MIAYFVKQPFLKFKKGQILPENPGQNWLDRNFVTRINMPNPKLERQERPQVKSRPERVPSERNFREEPAE